MSARALVAFLAVLGVVGLLAFGLLSKGEAKIALGQPAPDKTLPRLEGPGEANLADYRGKWVLLNFWASWCEPCRAEAPALEDFYRRHRRTGFTVLGVDLDDATSDAREFVAKNGLTYPQLRDGDGRERRDAYGMTGFPESFLVNPSGKLALLRRGPVTKEFLAEHVAPLIKHQDKQGSTAQ
jgi:cytochrome c biogenesis protein CcmG, thiol:disulfide interchange protein DsbE